MSLKNDTPNQNTEDVMAMAPTSTSTGGAPKYTSASMPTGINRPVSAIHEMAATWREALAEMQEQVTHHHVQEGEQIAMHMREARLEMLAAGIAVHPRLLVRCEVAQVDQEEAVEHEAPHDEEADRDVVLAVHGAVFRSTVQRTLVYANMKVMKVTGCDGQR
ncbi:MAG: hypothetical protein IPI41_19255 [Flavobacteriales bacterium]|nr:hypothetical protein [Flavobacteriales bacterium]